MMVLGVGVDEVMVVNSNMMERKEKRERIM